MRKLTGEVPTTMLNLAEGVDDGHKPMLIWNATVADSGKPTMITSFEPPRDKDITSAYEPYFSCTPGLVTAVRMSATFPYVSPMARPEDAGKPVGPAVALCDGGYADNFGAAPVYLIQSVATSEFQHVEKPVLWIQISVSQPPDKNQREFIAFTAAAPIWTLYGVRSTGQRARLQRTNQLASLRMGEKPKIVAFQYPVNGGPLSWVLSQSQKDAIKDGWRSHDWRNHDWRQKISQIRSFLSSR